MVQDIVRLRELCPAVAGLPSVDVAPSTWLSRMMEDDWATIAQGVCFFDSFLDGASAPAKVDAKLAHFRCDPCSAVFPSERGLLQHCRIAHKRTLRIKSFIDDSGVCPICRTNFRERYRVVRHVSDRRRPACRMQILASCPMLASEQVAAWEARDRERLRLARRAGSTHILATGSARTAGGKRIGHVQK